MSAHGVVSDRGRGTKFDDQHAPDDEGEPILMPPT